MFFFYKNKAVHAVLSDHTSVADHTIKDNNFSTSFVCFTGFIKSDLRRQKANLQTQVQTESVSKSIRAYMRL